MNLSFLSSNNLLINSSSNFSIIFISVIGLKFDIFIIHLSTK